MSNRPDSAGESKYDVILEGVRKLEPGPSLHQRGECGAAPMPLMALSNRSTVALMPHTTGRAGRAMTIDEFFTMVGASLS